MCIVFRDDGGAGLQGFVIRVLADHIYQILGSVELETGVGWLNRPMRVTEIIRTLIAGNAIGFRQSRCIRCLVSFGAKRAGRMEGGVPEVFFGALVCRVDWWIGSASERRLSSPNSFQYPDLANFLRRHLMRVAVETHEIGPLAGFERTFLRFLKLQAGSIACVER